MRLAFVTDVHFGPAATFNGKLRKLTHHAGPLTEEFAKRMRDHDEPDLVVNLGDVLEDQDGATDRRNYETFAATLDSIGKPVVHVAGNHDTVFLSDDDLLSIWNARPRPDFEEGPEVLSYSLDLDPLHIAVLRSVERKDQDVRLPEAQLQWLEADLARSSRPALVFVHHPLSEMRLEGNRWFEKAPHICRVAERRRVREIIEASGKVLAVFNGHVHWNHFDVIAGIPYLTLQSLTENLDDDAPGRPARAHAVVDIDERRLVCHVRGEHELRYQLELSRAQRALFSPQ